MFGFGGSTADDGIHGTAGFSGNMFDTESVENFFDGVSTAFAESHVVFFGTAFVAMTDDLNRGDVGTGIEALCILFDGGFGITANGRLIEVEVSERRLANRCIDTFFVSANFATGAIGIGQALRFGGATVIFTDLIGCAIFFNRFGIALGATASVAAFLTGGTVDASIRITVSVNTLARTTIANIAFVFFARTMLIITTFSTFGIETVLIIGLMVILGRAVRVFIALRIRGRASVSKTNHAARKNERDKLPIFQHRILLGEQNYK